MTVLDRKTVAALALPQGKYSPLPHLTNKLTK